VRSKQYAIFALGLLLVVAELATVGWNSHTDRPTNPAELHSNGQTVYLEYCAECHQTDGTGWSTLYPRLAGNPLVTLHDPEPIITTVKYGQGSMMPFREKLTSQQIAEVLTYIRSAWGNQAPAVSRRQIH
jgi:alcohol dehydrogenase (quinone), cytochrome c subunit